ncbi:hypothetical protein QTP88_015670 [Uroleucon formosanum]
MTDATTVLDELVKAKESIKRKYIALKTGSDNVQQLMTQTLKPIIDPLTKISNKHRLSLNKENIINKSKNSILDYNQQEIENWFQSTDLDKTYGPKKLPNGHVVLGDKEVKFLEDTILIDGTVYPSTSGLNQLLFLKNPLIFTDSDLEVYKSILIHTSAHLSTVGNKIKKGGTKYSTIISKLFPSGGELSMKLQKNNLVYWDNPNELVDRLRLLLASKAAGNTSMSKRGIANELHKPARKNFTRRRVNVYGKNDLWQADLVEMIPYSKKNKNYKYILTVIDCFTKRAWALPMKSKTGKEVTSAMNKILLEGSPKLLQLDNGKEFYNNTFDALMTKYNIHKYSTFSILKACIVERFNRTLKEKMFREFTARGSHEWISILPKLLEEYNNSRHRTIGMSPMQADANPESVKIKQREINKVKIKFKVGDNVRISTQKGVFTKGYLPNWSTEIFEIIKINKTLPVTYQLQDYMAILDMQCVLGAGNKYFIKEMSIVDTETWATQHWIFKNSKSMQDNKSRKTNKWLERNYHKLSIEYGDIEYEELDKILNSLKFTCIYVKGEQKKHLLMEFLPQVALINIEDLGCPRLDQICNEETLPCCIFHMEYNPKQCTFYKVFAIRKWFINNS